VKQLLATLVLGPPEAQEVRADLTAFKGEELEVAIAMTGVRGPEYKGRVAHPIGILQFNVPGEACAIVRANHPLRQLQQFPGLAITAGGDHDHPTTNNPARPKPDAFHPTLGGNLDSTIPDHRGDFAEDRAQASCKLVVGGDVRAFSLRPHQMAITEIRCGIDRDQRWPDLFKDSELPVKVHRVVEVCSNRNVWGAV